MLAVEHFLTILFVFSSQKVSKAANIGICIIAHSPAIMED
jgi:hypothetical protein